MNPISTFLIALIVLFKSALFAQLDTHNVVDTDRLKPIIYTPPRLEKRFLPAALENLGTNVLINRIDADLRQVHWGKITWKTWKTNIKTGFEPDYDHFTTNWLGHPIHGSFFYNAARTNGYNYWQSIPFTVAGSLVWEYFGETYPASEIDLFTTSFGGIYLGEMTHRFAEAIRYKAKNKVLKQIGITLFNPMSQVNSLFYKENTRPYSTLINPHIRMNVTVGGSYPFGHIQNNFLGTRAYIDYTLVYGDLFNRVKKKYEPFDFFIFKTWMNVSFKGKDSIFFNISSHAPLFVKSLSENSVICLSQHYDNLASDVYKIGSLAITGDYSFRHYWAKNNRLIGSAKIGIILFGSSKSDVIRYLYHSDDPEFQRDYVYGQGFSSEMELVLRIQKLGRLTANFNHWLIFTNHDIDGKEDLRLLIVDYNYPIWKTLSLGIQFNSYKRLAQYNGIKEFLKINNRYYEVKTLVSWAF